MQCGWVALLEGYRVTSSLMRVLFICLPTLQRVKSECALIPRGLHFRPRVPGGYHQLYRRMVSFGDQGQVELKGSLKQVLNDQIPSVLGTKSGCL